MNKLNIVKVLSMVLLVSSNVFGTNFVVQNKTDQTIYFLLDYVLSTTDVGAKLAPGEYIDTENDLKETRGSAALRGIRITLNPKDVEYDKSNTKKIVKINNPINFMFDNNIIGNGGIDFCGEIKVSSSTGQMLSNFSTQQLDKNNKYYLNISAVVIPDTKAYNLFKKKTGGFGPFAIHLDTNSNYYTIDTIMNKYKQIRGKQKEIADDDIKALCKIGTKEPLIPLLGNEID